MAEDLEKPRHSINPYALLSANISKVTFIKGCQVINPDIGSFQDDSDEAINKTQWAALT